MESQHPPTPKTPTAGELPAQPPAPPWIDLAHPAQVPVSPWTTDFLVVGLGTGILWVFFPHFTDHTIIHPFLEFLHSLSSP